MSKYGTLDLTKRERTPADCLSATGLAQEITKAAEGNSTFPSTDLFHAAGNMLEYLDNQLQLAEMPAWLKKLIQERVDASLDNACSNGYYNSVHAGSLQEVAIDMGTVDPAFEGAEPEGLEPFIEDWRRRHSPDAP